jgi:hypothetical protein
MTKPRLDAGVPRHLAGRYQLLDKLADGAMTTVWRGHDQVLGRDVAVKLLHADLAADERFAASFREEAVAAAGLTHPGIVRVFDTGDHDGVPYIIMELVEGPTVRDVLRHSGVIEPPRAARIAADVATALDNAHRLGVIHRDVKPGNILVTASGEVKVADFSIAKAAAVEEVTRTGEVLSTAGYLAPEQVAGGPVDARTDVYSLGVCLYEMLTGRPPFKSGSTIQTAMAHLRTEVLPPRAIRAGLPRELDAVVVKALAKSPADRYQSAMEMASALSGLAEQADAAEVAVATAPGGPPPVPIAGGAATTAVRPRSTSLVPPPRGQGFLRQEGRYLGVTLLIVALCAVAGVAGLVLVKPEVLPGVGADASPGTTAQARPLPVNAVAVLDPADGSEHDQELPNATDGDTDTRWTTEEYRNHSRFGNLKEGVGLIIDAGSPVQASSLEVLSASAGGRAEIRAANDLGGTIDAWEVVARSRELATRSTFTLRDGAAFRYWMVWLTDLPPTDDGQFRAEVREVRLRP